jgi:PAS domain S-box-containing protein
MKQSDVRALEKQFFRGADPLKKLLKVSLDLFEAKHTGILYGTNETKIRFLPTSMWDRGIVDRFDGRGARGLILKLFGRQIVTARGLSPVYFYKQGGSDPREDNDGIIAYVLRNCADYYKKGISVIICPDTDRYILSKDEAYLEIPFFVYNGNCFERSGEAIKVDVRIVKHFKSKNSIYIYLPDYGILVLNTADPDLLKLHHDRFVQEQKLRQRLDILIDLVETASLAYLGQLKGKKGAQLLWRKEKHLRQTSQELIDNERRYRDLYEHAPIAYVSLEPSGVILKCNYKARELSGFEENELIGRNAVDLFFKESTAQAEVKQMFERLVKGGSIKDLELRITPKNLSPVWVSLSVDAVRNRQGRMTELRMMIMDISQRKNLENQLIQAQKMEAIGTLAGGIAHDFNNILSPISGYTEMLLMDMDEKDPAAKSLNIILDCVNHAKNLVNQILTISRQKEHALKVLDADDTLKESMVLVKSYLPATIELNCRIEAAGSRVHADPVQFHQVVMNLVTNACHAVKDREKGRIDIILKTISMPKPFLHSVNGGSRGYVCLSVRDTGCGIKKEILDKIFDPYFSTKGEGEGSGIGLSVVHGIVESHGGVITVDSTENQGSQFDVYLPVCREDMAVEAASEDEMILESGTERILLVDDDKKVAVMETHMLEKLGYTVTCFTNSLNAVKVFKSNPHLFDLILTDMTMPDLTGAQLADKIYRIKPEIPVVLCTGLGDTVDLHKFSLPSIKGFLKKPVAIKELSHTLRQALEQV